MGTPSEDPGLPSTGWPVTSPSDVFGVRSVRVPQRARPILDDGRSVIVGWQWDTKDGYVVVATPDGAIVSRTEKGLESPLIDPIDLVLVFGGVLRILAKGAAAGGARLLTGRVAARTVAAQLAEHEAMALLGRTAVADRLPLLFTRTVLEHMREPSRFVPVQIIKMAIAHGVRSPDPRGVSGAFRYFIPMVRNGKEYGLEILLRDSDKTVLHVLYRAGMVS